MSLRHVFAKIPPYLFCPLKSDAPQKASLCSKECGLGVGGITQYLECMRPEAQSQPCSTARARTEEREGGKECGREGGEERGRE